MALIPQAAVGLLKGGGEFIHHHAAVFAIGDLGHKRGKLLPANRLLPKAEGLVAGLHLAHQFGVGALGFDQGGDAELVPIAVASHQPIGPVFLLVRERCAIALLNAVLLHQQPAVASFQQGFDQGVESVGVIRKMHLRQREALHPGQGLSAKEIQELVLPGADLKVEIWDRR